MKFVAQLKACPATAHVPFVTLHLLIVFACGAFHSNAFGQILGTASLNVERRGHTATLLQDGKVLIVGGENQSGVVGEAEIFDPITSLSSVAASSLTHRTDHTATKLPDGRVLVIGGRDESGELDSTEIYDPAAGLFSPGPSLIRPRGGHTATALSNGKILIVGGDFSSSAELYDPASDSFSLVTGSSNVARKLHSAIRLKDGQVLIVGGVSAQNTALNSAEIYNPATQSFYSTNNTMLTARALAVLRLLPDGKVQVIGGDSDYSMEVFDPQIEEFNALALMPPAPDLLPQTLSTQSRAALISPLIGQHPTLQGTLSAQTLELLDRADQSITELPQLNKALVVGGVNEAGQVLSSAVLVKSSSATITTDKIDYAPGEIVTITGTGWQPNETVSIIVHEEPEEYSDSVLWAVAGPDGKFTNAEFSPQPIDIGRVFSLTASGQSSGFAAQTTFKDAELVAAELGGTVNDVTLVQGNINVPFTISLSATGAIKCVATSANPARATVRTSYSINAAGVVSSSTPSGALNFFGGTVINANNCNVTWTGAPTPYSVAASVSSNALTPAGNYTIVLSPAAGTTTVTTPSGPGGSLDDNTPTNITVHVRLAAPSGLTANGVSQSQIDLSWVDNSTGENNFVIESSPTGVSGSFTTLATVGAGVNSYSDTTGLTCGTTRYYQVKATKTSPIGLNSDYSNVASSTTSTCNSPPNAGTISGNSSVDEGSSHSYSSNATDPDGDTLSYTWSVISGNGSIASGQGTSSVTLNLSDGPSTVILHLVVDDGHGHSVSPADRTITVNNVPPTIALTGANSVNEGSSYTLNLGAITDPGQDTVTGYSINWGDGSTENFSGSPASSTQSHTHADGPNNYTITVSLTDEDGTFTGGTKAVTVNNVAPTVAYTTAPTSANEGDTKTYNFTVNDPGQDTYNLSAGFPDCGTGGNLVANSLNVGGNSGSQTGSFQCSFPDGPASPQVKIQFTDSDNAAGNTASVTVTLANVAPTIALTGLNSVNEGSSYTLNLGAITDPGQDTVTSYSINWGDGSTENFSGSPANPSSKTHTYADGPNNYTITVSLTDEDGTFTGGTKAVTVNNVAPTITGISVSASQTLIGVSVTFTGSATDPSAVDTNAGFKWKWSVDGGPYGGYGSPGANTLAVSFSTCGTHYVTAVADDKDGGESAPLASGLVSVYEAHYLQPLDEGVYNLVQKGRVVPVKVTVECGGTQFAGLAPAIQLLKGDFTAAPESSLDEIETLSSSAADTTGIMRPNDSRYIYNLQVPSNGIANEIYTIRVRPFGGTNTSDLRILLKIRK